MESTIVVNRLDNLYEFVGGGGEIGSTGDINNDADQRILEDGKDGKGQGEDFLKELKQYSGIVEDIKFLESASEEIADAKEQMESVVDQTRDKIISKVDSKLSKARTKSSKLKKQLTDKGGLKDKIEKLNSEEKNEGSIKVEIRNNLYQYHMGRYFRAHKRYTRCANVFKDCVRERTKRDMKNLDGALTDAQAEQLIDQGLDQQFMQDRISGDAQELDRLMHQADEVKQINQGVREILEMFQEMAALVDQQQETIDNITSHISAAKGYTGEAAHELHLADEYLTAARKKQLICAVLVLLVLAVIIIIILASTGAFDSK
uniref:t-SNARE coiled-coil homology domain-containing protein n=1 Tax=Lotharella oceanica TaxID=641309 RepID=A0A7S2TJV5_9EUKA